MNGTAQFTLGVISHNNNRVVGGGGQGNGILCSYLALAFPVTGGVSGTRGSWNNLLRR